MGILSDFANSAAGDLTIGAFEGLNEAAQKDVVVNATASNSSLDRENKAYDLVELVYKNKDELKKKLLLNPSEFGLFAQDGQSLDSVADRFTNFMMLNNRSIFEHKNFNNVMLDAAKFMAAGIDQGGFTIYDPYISGEDRFNQEKELHQARISEITKMPKADKLLMKLREAEEGVATPESITDELLKVQALTAKGFGILNTFPTTFEGRKNLEASQVSIIVSNAINQFPDDSQARQTFINQKLYENNIDPLDGIRYKSTVTYSQMAKIMETEGISLANQITNLTNMMASADGEKQEQINNQKNLLLLEQHKLMDKYSAQAVTALAGKDRSTIFPEERETGEVPLPLAAEGYVPTINSEGNLVIDLANGNRQTLPLEVLIDSPESVKLLPIEAQNYVNQIKSKLFVDGEMIKPTREMFEDGAAGDKAFRDFLGIYNLLNIEERDMSVEGTGVTDMDPLSEKEKIKKEFEEEKKSFKDADITKFKETPKGDEIKIEELAPADTIVPKKKPDQPEEPKEKSLQEKIDEDFGNANVGTSAGAEFGLSASKDMDFKSTMRKSESSDNYMVVNKEGYMGAFQFGDARLQDYKTANKEEFTNQEFLNNKDLQEKVFDWHVGDIVKYIQDNNLDEAIGKKVNGVVITLNGLVAAAHLGGKFGMRQYVESGFDKKFNKEDSNGTSLFDYIQRFQLTK